MKLLRILLILSFSMATVTDIDGNVYEIVLIGDQLWMPEGMEVNVVHSNKINREEALH